MPTWWCRSHQLLWMHLSGRQLRSRRACRSDAHVRTGATCCCHTTVAAVYSAAVTQLGSCAWTLPFLLLQEGKVKAIESAMGGEAPAGRVLYIPAPSDSTAEDPVAELASRVAGWAGVGAPLPPADPAAIACFIAIPGTQKFIVISPQCCLTTPNPEYWIHTLCPQAVVRLC
jgi:hypothetical protein